MRIINCTGKNINLFTSNEKAEYIISFKRSGNITARIVENRYCYAGNIELNSSINIKPIKINFPELEPSPNTTVNISKNLFQVTIVGLPNPRIGNLYIVDKEICYLAYKRNDLVYPSDIMGSICEDEMDCMSLSSIFGITGVGSLKSASDYLIIKYGAS